MSTLSAVSLRPFVPSGGDYDASRRLFADLGFEETWEHDGYAEFRCGDAQFVLQKLDAAAFAEHFMVRLDVTDLDAWWEAVSRLELEARYPGLRIRPPTEFPWGREVHLIDLAGVCWHVGQAGPGRPESSARFHPASPILRVRNLQASIDYYTGALGFTVDWVYENVMASTSRDRANLMLCEGDQGQPGTWVWIGVADAATLFEECVAKGADVRLPPTNYPWALEMHVQDPDGHVLRLGSAPRTDEPYADWVFWYRDGPGA